MSAAFKTYHFYIVQAVVFLCKNLVIVSDIVFGHTTRDEKSCPTPCTPKGGYNPIESNRPSVTHIRNRPCLSQLRERGQEASISGPLWGCREEGERRRRAEEGWRGGTGGNGRPGDLSNDHTDNNIARCLVLPIVQYHFQNLFLYHNLSI